MGSVKAHLKCILTFFVPAPSMCLNYFISSYRRKRIFILYFPLVFTYEICKCESKGSDFLGYITLMTYGHYPLKNVTVSKCDESH